MCDELRARAGRRDPAVWAAADVVAFTQQLAVDYAGYWKQDMESAAGAESLAEWAIAILVAGRLARHHPDGLEARPGAGRYAAIPAVMQRPAASSLLSALEDA